MGSDRILQVGIVIAHPDHHRKSTGNSVLSFFDATSSKFGSGQGFPHPTRMFRQRPELLGAGGEEKGRAMDPMLTLIVLAWKR
jgi:hypothetical protein